MTQKKEKDFSRLTREYRGLHEQFEKEIDVLIREIMVETMFNSLDADISNCKYDIIQDAVKNVSQDLERFTKEDPAAHDNYEVASESESFRAVRYYRYANAIYRLCPRPNEATEGYILMCVRRIAEDTKSKTKIDIHPHAQIGSRFIIDHGVNTVIGERCIIGDDFYVMQDVVLGAGTAKEKPEVRHPKIGNNVVVYGGAKILGNIKIGNNCTIGANCIVTRNVPDDMRVSLVNQLQLTKDKGASIDKKVKRQVHIYGVLYEESNRLVVMGNKLYGLSAEILSAEHMHHESYYVNIIEASDSNMCLALSSTGKSVNQKTFFVRLFNDDEGIDIILRDCLAFGCIDFDCESGGREN